MSLVKEKIKRFKGNINYDYNAPKEVEEAIISTFDLSSKKLPSKKTIKPFLKEREGFSGVSDFLTSYYIRELYLEHAFVAYNDEMLTSLKKFCDSKKMKVVHEVCCGTGWFSHWMKKYKIPLKKSIDNKTWISYNNRNNFLPNVIKQDAVKFVRNNRRFADMIVLSWPYMDNTATRIWNAMKPGQYLLYIGEDYGGCTADSSFFNAVRGCEITNDENFNKVYDSFVQFNGLHDNPKLYLKK